MSLLIKVFLSFFLTIIILVWVHELGHYMLARLCNIQVKAFAIGLGRPLFQWTNKVGTQFRLGWLPIGGYVKMLHTEENNVPNNLKPYAFDQQAVGKRIMVVTAGPVFNFLFAWLCFLSILMMGYPKIPPIIAQIIPKSPAANAGLQPKDKILEINKKPVQDWISMAHWIRQHPNKSIILKIKRHHQYFNIRLTLQNNYGIGFLGLGSPTLDQYKPHPQTIYPNIFAATKDAGTQTIAMIYQNFVGIFQLVTGKSDADAKLEGPISIAKNAQVSIQQGIKSYFIFLALVSISLGVINLLPIPILDGGQLMFLLVELIFQQPLSKKIQLWAMQIGASILLCLMFIALGHDIFS